MSKIIIYYSFPFKYEKQALNHIKTIKQELDISNKEIPYMIRLPEYYESKNDEYFYADIHWLDKSNILLSYIPECSVGTVAELTYFKTKYNFRPAIGFKCFNHGWLKRLFDYQIEDIKEVTKLLDDLINQYYLN